MRKTILRRLLSVIALAAFVVISSAEARAVDFPCAQGIAQIKWDTGALYIDCVGQTGFAAIPNPPTDCQINPGIDNIKLFESLAMSALLSGKILTIGYRACSAGPRIIGTLTVSR